MTSDNVLSDWLASLVTFFDKMLYSTCKKSHNIPIILKVVANHYRVKFYHRLIRCILINYLRYTIKLIMGDVGQIGVSEEQSWRCLVLIQICFNVIQ